MQDLNDLHYYVQVVTHGGFAAAGRALNIPKSKLSRRIALLEERLGVRLIQRSSRHFSVTDIGQEYFRHCQAMLVEADAAQELIDRNQAEPQGVIKMSCPPALMYFNVADMVSRFMVACPRVAVHLDVTNRNVDVLGEGVDIALRVRFPPLADSDLVMKRFAVSTQRLVAHPRLIEQGAPQTPAQLEQLPTLGLGGAQQQHTWALENDAGERIDVHHQPRLIINDMIGLRAAALQGVGVAPLPLMMIHQQLLQGTLVEVLPQWKPQGGIVHAAFPSRRGLLPAVRHLLDFLADEFNTLIDAEKGYVAPGD
ncbi:MAG: LysR family transcriptional regulator [Gammaproteobacteria bacterium]|jgi:DNA-binding transcriptional LysR family regulator|nr:LysR family transcriptional regulator [Gammaproteobacteria bacterium]MBQ0774941.1 LysR family transcriptional regulator [Gammaproteobacteria bacterium]|tara:strand:+ start:39286 stop:40215 length:930 start_codon:yes stop_codon:yes gene_type:complete